MNTNYWNLAAFQSIAKSSSSGSDVTVEIVIPVFNEEAALPRCLYALQERLADNFPYAWRITVADNGSTDGTASIARKLTTELPGVGFVHLNRKGRGLALRTVWAASDADIVAYMDVDLSANLDYLDTLISPLACGNCDLAIGSRMARTSITSRRPHREVISRTYNAIVRLMHGVTFSDTQCGFKAARAPAIMPLLAMTKDDSWFFDTELLLLAWHNDFRVQEIPISWTDNKDSKVAIIRTALEDLRGLWCMARRRVRGEATIIPGFASFSNTKSARR